MKSREVILAEGDLRSIGKANDIAIKVNSQKDFDALFSLLFFKNRLVVMRVADAVEKITRKRPEFLASHKQEILDLMHKAANKELKWHVASLLPRLSLTKLEQEETRLQLSVWLLDKKESRIVRVNSLQALCDMKQKFNWRNSSFLSTIEQLQKENIPSLNARLRKIKPYSCDPPSM